MALVIVLDEGRVIEPCGQEGGMIHGNNQY